MKTCVIGDIHGCHSSLVNLLDRILNRADTLVFVGDYVDRGPDTQQVLETLVHLRTRHPHVIFLKGNHEYMLLNYLIGRESADFLSVGGRETFASYGIDPYTTSPSLRGRLPLSHVSFLENLPLFYEDRHGIYVHAGLQPGRHLSTQTPEWCLWVRDRFLRASFDFGKPVVFGHTVFPEPLVEADKIGIDTGAVYGGKLTALILPDMEFVQVDGEKKQPFPIRL